MPHAPSARPRAGAPAPIPQLLAGLLLCGAILLPAAAPARACGLDWASVAPLVQWTDDAVGPFTFPMTAFGGASCPPGLMVTITVSQGATSGFFLRGANGTTSHREDCAPGLGCTVNNFGVAQDLAVIFNPTAGGTSPVTVTAVFSSPFPDLKFEISDIDFGGNTFPSTDPTGHRLDQVTITSDAGVPTSITPKTAGPYTFVTPIVGNTVTAKCTGSEATNCNSPTDTTAAVPLANNNPDPDSGTILVDFTGKTVTTMTITYTEAGNDSDPAGRGIGVLGHLTPVELMSFTID